MSNFDRKSRWSVLRVSHRLNQGATDRTVAGSASVGLSTEPLHGVHRIALLSSVTIATLLAVLLYQAMSPGGMSTDTFFQLAQATGQIPYNDWHPVSMTWTWQLLIDLTGQINSILVLQVFFAWVCAVLTAYYLIKVSRRSWSAFLGIFVLYMPNTVNIVGVVWKDTQMALAMYLAVILMLLVRVVPRAKWAFAAVAVGALVYAALVRKNSAIAVLPVLAVFTVWMIKLRIQQRRRSGKTVSPVRLRTLAVAIVTVFIGFGVLIGVVEAGVNSVTQPSKNSQFTQVLIDDLVFAIPQKAIDRAHAPQAEKDRLAKAKRVCADKNKKAKQAGASEHIWNAYWVCYGRGADGPFTEVQDPAAVTSIWKQTVPSHLGDYASYRVRTTTVFLSQSTLQFLGEGKAVKEGYPPDNPQLRAGLKAYVTDFGVELFPWIYVGGVALILSAVGVYTAGRKKYRSIAALAIFSSGILYLMTYFPTAPAANYRYCFWPWLATMLGWLVLMAERKYRRNRKRAAGRAVSSD